jgi:hypothetical protein
MIEYGFSTRTSDLEDIIGLDSGDLARLGLDLDLADDCRWLKGRGVDLRDEAAIRANFDKDGARHGFSRYVDALVRVAKDYCEA